MRQFDNGQKTTRSVICLLIIWRSRKPGTKYGLRYLDAVRSIECIWYSLVLNWSHNRSLCEEWVKMTCRNVTNGLRWRLKTLGTWRESLKKEGFSGVGAKGAESGGKDRQIRRPFHPDCKFCQDCRLTRGTRFLFFSQKFTRV